MSLSCFALAGIVVRLAAVDIGAQPASTAVRAAVEAAMGARAAGTPAERSLLWGESIEAEQARQGTAAQGRAEGALGKLDFDGASRALDEAERIWGALPISEAKEHLAAVYRHRAALAGAAGDSAAAARWQRLAKILGEGGDGSTSSTAEVSLIIECEPSDAEVWIDGRLAKPPHAVGLGPHVLDVERSDHRKWHRVIEVAPPGPVRLAVTLAPLVRQANPSLGPLVEGLRGVSPETKVSALARLSERLKADRLLLVGAEGDRVTVRLYDAEAGALLAKTFHGGLERGRLPGLGEFAFGGQVPAQKVRGVSAQGAGSSAAPAGKSLWKRWSTWVVIGAVAAATTVLVVGSAESGTQLDLRSRH